MTYDHANEEDRGDEIMVVQRDQTLFKGFLKPGGEIVLWNSIDSSFVDLSKDQFTFKSRRFFDRSRVKLEFYINDFFEDQLVACCEHALVNSNEKHLFQVERVVGSKYCQRWIFHEDFLSKLLFFSI